MDEVQRDLYQDKGCSSAQSYGNEEALSILGEWPLICHICQWAAIDLSSDVIKVGQKYLQLMLNNWTLKVDVNVQSKFLDFCFIFFMV